MKKDMTEGREGRTILFFALPIMGANLLQVVYTLVDSLIVANFVGPGAMGAVGTVSATVWLLVMVGSGLGSGTSIAVSQYFGAPSIEGCASMQKVEHLDLLMMFIWVNTISNITCGFLQGAGDVKIPAVSGFVNLGIRLALSYAPAGTAVSFRCIYVSMPPAWLAACALVLWRYRSGKWRDHAVV